MASVLAQCHHIIGLRTGVANNICFLDEHTVLFPSGNNCVRYNIDRKCQKFIPGTSSLKWVNIYIHLYICLNQWCWYGVWYLYWYYAIMNHLIYFFCWKYQNIWSPVFCNYGTLEIWIPLGRTWSYVINSKHRSIVFAPLAVLLNTECCQYCIWPFGHKGALGEAECTRFSSTVCVPMSASLYISIFYTMHNLSPLFGNIHFSLGYVFLCSLLYLTVDPFKTCLQSNDWSTLKVC